MRFLVRIGLVAIATIVLPAILFFLYRFHLSHSPCPAPKKNDRIFIITAFSDNHFSAGMALIQDVEKYPDQLSLVVYNLGLNNVNLARLANFSSDRVSVRNFSFDKYPSFVSDLVQYRWKPILIHQCAKEYPQIVWMDASMRLCSDFVIQARKVFAMAKSGFGLVLPHPTGHSIWAATNPQLYKTFKIPEDEAKTLDMFSANTIFAYKNTKSTALLNKWQECALEEECMAPKGSGLFCEFASGDKWSTYANCHRFDQSVINIILAIESGGDSEKYSIANFSSITGDRPCSK